MRSVESILLATTAITTILKSAGLICGNELTAPELELCKDDVIFWDVTVSNKSASEKETYVTWNIISSDEIDSADDKVHARDIYAIIDIYTRSRVISSKIRDLLISIDAAVKEAKWNLELNDAFTFDSSTKMYNLSFELSKIYQGGN